MATYTAPPPLASTVIAEIAAPDQAALAEHATAIRALGKLNVAGLLRLHPAATKAALENLVVEHLTVEDLLTALERKLPEAPKVCAVFKALERALRAALAGSAKPVAVAAEAPAEVENTTVETPSTEWPEFPACLRREPHSADEAGA